MHRSRRRDRRRLSPPRCWWVLTGAVALTIALLTGSVESGLTATIGNSANSAGVGQLLLKATPPATGCDTATVVAFTGVPTATCRSASLLPAATPASSAVTLTADGTLPVAGQLAGATAKLTPGPCGPVQLANSVAPADPMLVRGGVAYQQAGPLTGSSGLGLDGVAASHSLASNVVTQSSASLLGTSFSAAVWFKLASGASGPLLGFGASPNDTAESTSDYPAMWVTAGGKVQAGVRSTVGSVVATSSGSTAYNDGQWHLAVVTITSAVALIVVSVYVDTAAAGSSTVLLSLATGFTGYWHAGWSPVSSAPWNSGTSNYLTGTLADLAVFPSVLSAATVAGLAGSGSQSTWNTRVAAAGATSSWPLGDDGTAVYAGVLPVVGSTAVCTFVDVTVGGPTFCVYPNSGSAPCGAPASQLSALAASGPLAFAPVVAAGTVVLTTTTARDSTYATTCATFCPGLHLLLPIALSESLGVLGSVLSLPAGQTVI